MKKTIGKPENWQDFESLCKKLWGEIWCIADRIKKNGRLGQKQAGVDVYGIPKGKNSYWGIQAKGKDDYSNAGLTENEIDKEIIKAKSFKPELSVYIIATTSNKDSKIEEYIRIKDAENRKQGSFEILLYCWEDIVDLIEENRNTYNWYVNELMHKTKFDFQVLFNDFQEILEIKPLLEKKIINHFLINKSYEEIISKHRAIIENINYPLNQTLNRLNLFLPSNDTFVNKSWIDFDIILQNTGSNVLEDWKFTIKFISGVQSLDNKITRTLIGDVSFINVDRNNPRHIDNEDLSIKYAPKEKTVLVQKDYKRFNTPLLIKTDATEIKYEWEIIARDFDLKGEGVIIVSPMYIEKIEEKETIFEEEVKQEIIIDYFKEKKTHNLHNNY